MAFVFRTPSKRRRRRPLGPMPSALPMDQHHVSAITQPKLRVSQPGDAQEREADAVADRITGGFESNSISEHSSEINRSCADCDEEKEEQIQAKAETSQSHPPVSAPLAQRLQQRRGLGQPMPKAQRAFFEPRFGRDLSGVRLHTDAEAQALSGQISARAFTFGQNIFFNRGEFRPEAAEGRHLLAHELTHTLQQPENAGTSLQREEQESEDSYQYGPDEFHLKPFAETCEPEAVNDTAVQNLIDDALERNNEDPGQAFSTLRQARENQCCEVDPAAAEHYMYARSEVGSGTTSYDDMVSQIRWYARLKRWAPDSLTPRTGDCPPTPSSSGQVDWAMRGARHGKEDKED